jgi:hypothetical protein
LPWRVVAVAPIAGPYDLSGTEFPEMIDGPSTDSSAYMAYLALSYTQIAAPTIGNGRASSAEPTFGMHESSTSQPAIA